MEGQIELKFKEPVTDRVTENGGEFVFLGME